MDRLWPGDMSWHNCFWLGSALASFDIPAPPHHPLLMDQISSDARISSHGDGMLSTVRMRTRAYPRTTSVLSTSRVRPDHPPSIIAAVSLPTAVRTR